MTERCSDGHSPKRESAYRAIETPTAAHVEWRDQDEIIDAVAAAGWGAIVVSPDVDIGLAAEVRLRACHNRAVVASRAADSRAGR